MRRVEEGKGVDEGKGVGGAHGSRRPPIKEGRQRGFAGTCPFHNINYRCALLSNH